MTEARAKPWSAGLLVGWGFETDRRSALLGADAYGLGFGLRGGYTLDMNLYAGAFAMYYLGGSQTGSNANTADLTTSTSSSALLCGVEVGYDWWIGPLIVRPSLQIGPFIGFTNSRSVGDPERHLGRGAVRAGRDCHGPVGLFFPRRRRAR